MTIIYILGWIILSILVGKIGASKQIGGLGAFFISLIFSPIIGLLFVIGSTLKAETKIVNPKVIELTTKAIEHDINKEYKMAIDNLLEALTYEPKSSQIHFNLTLIFSKIMEKDKAFNHLEKAVELGYENFQKIANSNNLKWLREQSEYADFISNGYKINNSSNLKNDYIHELNELGKLKEKGILTEFEFNTQKDKILKFRI